VQDTAEKNKFNHLTFKICTLLSSTQQNGDSDLAIAIGKAWEACGQKMPIDLIYNNCNISINQSGNYSYTVDISKDIKKEHFESRTTGLEALNQKLSAIRTFSKIKELNPDLRIDFKVWHDSTGRTTARNAVDAGEALSQPKICLDLSGASLFNINLSGLDLQDVQMEKSDLSYAQLTGANLTNANMVNATLTRADLCRAELQNAKLSAAVLINVNLDEANLTNADLDYVRLTDSTLNGTELSGASMNISLLQNTKLSNVNMNHAKLSKSLLLESNLTNVNMTNAKIHNITFNNVVSLNLNLSDADISFAKIEESIFEGANLEGANLEDAGIVNSAFENTNFKRTNLLRTKFENVDLAGADFRQSNVPHAIITGKNHAQWEPTRLDPMTRVHLDNAVDAPINLPARPADVLNTGLQEFETKTANPSENNAVTRNKKDSAKSPPFPVSAMDGRDNLLYVQYSLQAMAQETDPALRQRAIDTYCNQYLKQNNVALHTQSALFEPPEGSLPLPADGLNIVLMGRSGGAIICSPETYHKMIAGKQTDAWNNVGVYKYDAGNHSSVELSAKEINFRTLLAEEYPQLLPAWEKAYYGESYNKILEVLDLPEEFAARFEQAAEVQALPNNKKLVDGFAKPKLLEAFSRYYTVDSVTTAGSPASLTLNAEHEHKLLSALKLTDEPPEKQAQALLVLGMIMTKASSTNLFGTNNDSPEALRYYASALLSAAHQRSSDVVPNEAHNHWQGKLLSDSCTQELYLTMRTYLFEEAHDSKKIFTRLMPRAWQ